MSANPNTTSKYVLVCERLDDGKRESPGVRANDHSVTFEIGCAHVKDGVAIERIIDYANAMRKSGFESFHLSFQWEDEYGSGSCDGARLWWQESDAEWQATESDDCSEILLDAFNWEYVYITRVCRECGTVTKQRNR